MIDEGEGKARMQDGKSKKKEVGIGHRRGDERENNDLKDETKTM